MLLVERLRSAPGVAALWPKQGRLCRGQLLGNVVRGHHEEWRVGRGLVLNSSAIKRVPFEFENIDLVVDACRRASLCGGR